MGEGIIIEYVRIFLMERETPVVGVGFCVMERPVASFLMVGEDGLGSDTLGGRLEPTGVDITSFSLKTIYDICKRILSMNVKNRIDVCVGKYHSNALFNLTAIGFSTQVTQVFDPTDKNVFLG
jgi:hypothetical protein